MSDLNDKQQLHNALVDARQWTLSMYAHLTPSQGKVPYLTIVNPPWWEIAHVGWFQEFWCLRQRKNASSPPSRLKDADRFFDSRSVPHASRWTLPLPFREDVTDYLATVLEDTLNALENSLPEEQYFFQLALLHEDMHAEAMRMTLQTLGYPAPAMPNAKFPSPAPQPVSGDICLPGGEFLLGSPASASFVFDNEKWAHPVTISPFAISATTVTNEAFAEFVEDGGYQTRAYWSAPGWQWREKHRVAVPRYWHKDKNEWFLKRFDRLQPLAVEEPVIHVSYFEADAWCRWAGRRLPTEAEWEYASRNGRAVTDDHYPWGSIPLDSDQVSLDGAFERPVPVSSLPGTDTPHGVRQMIGNVWEWTASSFMPYPGFSADPYKEYSAPWFHDHMVVRGGAFCTRSRLIHNRLRNFYTPDRNDVFVGFRSCPLS